MCRSIEERSLVYFADNPPHLLEAYADSGEGVDRAGGFAVQVRLSVPSSIYIFTERTNLTSVFFFFSFWNNQGLGGVLIRKIDGDYQNVVGFPVASFFKFLDVLIEEEEDFLGI